jgi:membrane-associated phospholipid phosphatase
MNTLARWVSILGHPFVVTAVLVAGVALRLAGPREAVRSLLLVGLIALLPLAILMRRQVRRGAWAHVDASHRAERPILFAVGLISLAVLLVAALVVRPGSFLIRGALGVLIMLALCAIVTRWIKLSLHMAFGALATTILLFLRSPAGWVLLVALPVLGWSRLALKRHTVSEIVAGLVLGAAFGYAIYSL